MVFRTRSRRGKNSNRLKIVGIKVFQKKSSGNGTLRAYSHDSTVTQKLVEQMLTTSETVIQMTLSLLLFFYGTSPTRTSHALLSLFNKESANDQLSQNETCFGVNLSSDSKIGIEVNVLKCLPTTVAIILNFSLSFISFTR